MKKQETQKQKLKKYKNMQVEIIIIIIRYCTVTLPKRAGGGNSRGTVVSDLLSWTRRSAAAGMSEEIRFSPEEALLTSN